MSDSLKEQYSSTPLYGSNANAVEALYEKFLIDPESVPQAWRDYFETLGADDTEIAHSAIREELLEGAKNRARVRQTVTGGGRSLER